MSKTFYLVIAVVVFLAAGYWWWQNGVQLSYAPQTAMESDTTSAINSDLSSVNVGDVDSEFQLVDQDLNNL